MAVRLLLVWLLCGGGLLAQSSNPEAECDREVLQVTPLRRQIPIGASELVPSPGLLCSGGEPGETVSIDVGFAWNAFVSNPFLLSSEAAINAVVVVDSPEPGTAVEGVDYFPLQYDPAVPNAVFVEGLTYQAHEDGSPTRLSVFNIRLNTTGFPLDTETAIQMLHNVNGSLVDEDPVDIATVSGHQPTRFQITYDTETQEIRLQVAEETVGAMLPRFLYGGAPQDDADDALLRAGWAQTGWTPRNDLGLMNIRYAADTGSRVGIELSGVPEGVFPVARVSSFEENRRTIALVQGPDYPVRTGGSKSYEIDMDDEAYLLEQRSGDIFGLTMEVAYPDVPFDRDDFTEELFGSVEFSVELGFECDERGLSAAPTDMQLRAGLYPLSRLDAVPLLPENYREQAVPLPGPAYDPNVGTSEGITFDPRACQPVVQRPEVSENGVTNGASFQAGGVSPGQIVSVFGTGLGEGAPAAAGSLPLPMELSGTRVIFAGQRTPTFFKDTDQVNIQIPHDLPLAAPIDLEGAKLRPMDQTQRKQRTAPLAEGVLSVIVNGVVGPPVRVPIFPATPAIFTVGGGAGPAIAINPDSSLAHRQDSIAGINTRPVNAGEALVILATGLGLTNPIGITGDDSYDDNGMFVQRDTLLRPRVTIGGAEAELLFSGLSPEFPGVYQINVRVAHGTPPGDAQPLVIHMNGVSSSEDATIAVAE